MKNKLSNLINVKSIVTIVLTVIFSILSLKGVITGNDFLTVFTVIIAFYFGTQKQKDEDKK